MQRKMMNSLTPGITSRVIAMKDKISRMIVTATHKLFILKYRNRDFKITWTFGVEIFLVAGGRKVVQHRRDYIRYKNNTTGRQNEKKRKFIFYFLIQYLLQNILL